MRVRMPQGVFGLRVQLLENFNINREKYNMNNTTIVLNGYKNALFNTGYSTEQVQQIFTSIKDATLAFKDRVEQSSPEYKKAVAMALSSGATALMAQVTALANQANENYSACREDETCDFALKGVSASFAALAVATIAYKSINGLLSKNDVDQTIEALATEENPDEFVKDVAKLFESEEANTEYDAFMAGVNNYLDSEYNKPTAVIFSAVEATKAPVLSEAEISSIRRKMYC